MKRTCLLGPLALLLVVCLAAALLPTASAAGDCADSVAVPSAPDTHGRLAPQNVAAQQGLVTPATTVSKTWPTGAKSPVGCDVWVMDDHELSPKPTQRAPLPFTDVAEKDWYYEAVCFAYDSGMMNGMGGGIFQPDGRTTRAQVATLTHRLCGNVELPDILTEPFVDVQQTSWFYPGVVFAYNSDIIRGKTETIFAPNFSASRQDMITMLYRMVVSAELKAETKGDLRQFVDGDQVAPYAREAMSWAVGEGLIVGVLNDGGKLELQPEGTTSRAQLATIIMRFMDLEFEVAPGDQDCVNDPTGSVD